MKLNKIAFVLGLGALLVLQACHSDKPHHREQAKIIMLQSTGEVSVQPNEASITIYLNCLDKDIKKSKDCLVEKSEALNKQLESYGIKKEDIMTTAINRDKEHDWVRQYDGSPSKRIFKGYRSSVTTRVTVKDLKVLEELYPELLEDKDIDVHGLSLTHSDMDSLNNAAYMNAVDKADVLAEQLVERMGASEKEILRIGNTALPAMENDFYMEDREDKIMYNMQAGNTTLAKSKITINNGTVYVHKNLTIEYRVK